MDTLTTPRRAGLRVPQLREAAGLSQWDLSARLLAMGLPQFRFQNQVSRVELGRRFLTREEAAAFADVLGVDVDELLEGTDDVDVASMRRQQAEHLRQMGGCQLELAELKRKRSMTTAEMERHASLEGHIAYHDSIARLLDTKISQLLHDIDG
jgi:transcriptional regulator with XRE-family HTH domain